MARSILADLLLHLGSKTSENKEEIVDKLPRKKQKDSFKLSYFDSVTAL